MEDAAYFMKFALGSYGWALYIFMNPCSGPWSLCGGIRYVHSYQNLDSPHNINTK